MKLGRLAPLDRPLAATLAVTLLIATAVGAYAHWLLWVPADVLLIYLAGAALFLAAVLLAVVPRPAVRRLSVFPLAAALGLMLGQVIGPSRPALVSTDAALSATLDRPGITSGEGRGSCDTAGGSELQVEGNLRLDLRPDDPSAPPDVDQREFVTVSLSVGDRWRDGAIHRSDDVDLLVIIGSAAADVPEVPLAADDASRVELAWTPAGGTLRFDRLVVDRARSGSAAVPLDLSGTLSWTCGDRPPPDGAAEMAEAACAGSTYAACREDMLRAMDETPGALVAVCEVADGGGAVIALEREADAQTWCAAEGSGGVVRKVLRLPEE
jgi:hypothetical protein